MIDPLIILGVTGAGLLLLTMTASRSQAKQAARLRAEEAKMFAEATAAVARITDEQQRTWRAAPGYRLTPSTAGSGFILQRKIRNSSRWEIGWETLMSCPDIPSAQKAIAHFEKANIFLDSSGQIVEGTA
ncbi:MAG: hypothetical protein AB7F35_00720 [Acetobacteraceae bacterium]